MKNDATDLQSDIGPAESFLGTGVAGPLQEGRYFRKVLELLPVAIYITDADGRITFYNEAAATLWGHRPELGKSVWCGSWKLWSPDGSPLPHEHCSMALALKQKRAVHGTEAVAERPDGTRVPFAPYPILLHDAAGTLVGAVNLLVDLTDRKRGEEYAQRLTSIVENSDDAIVSKDLNGVITSWNRGAERLFGYTAEEVIGKPITILIPPDKRGDEPMILERIRHGERVAHYDTVRCRKDGRLTDISLTVSPVRDAAGKIIGASKIARDISERKRAFEQQRLLLDELKHRIKNSLAMVRAIATRTFRGASVEERAAFAGRIQALANAQDLLTGESWNQAPLRDVVLQALQPCEEKHRERFQIEGPGGVWLDATKSSRLTMVLHELATNAVKYGALSNSSGRVLVTWEVSTGESGTRASLRWQESGGPSVEPPKERGFGSLLIENAFDGHSGKAQLEFCPDGVVCILQVSL